MTAKRVQVSLDTELLHRIDLDPEARTRGRSAFIRAAVEAYLAAKERQEVESRLTQPYAGGADAMLAEVTELLGRQSWPAD
jgi:metal-responsive CopG/Arc/MetJ family transcriptional regulator